MRKSTKYLLAGLGLVIALPLIAVAIIIVTFDPNDYKPMLVELVKEKTGRTLSIPGELKLSLYPKIGIDIGQARLSERNSNEQFASIDRAQLSAALLPLFSGRLIVDHVFLGGLNAHLERFPDGTTNIDDFFVTDEKETKNQKLDFSIDGVRVANANIVFDDRQQKRRLQATNLNLETGGINDGEPSKVVISTHIKGDNPQVAANLAAQGEVRFDSEKQHFVAKGLEAKVDGAYADWKDIAVKVSGNADVTASHFLLNKLEVEGRGSQGGRTIQGQLSTPELTIKDERVKAGPLRAKAQISEGGRNIAANFTAPAFEGTPQSFTLPSIALDAVVKQAELDAKATVTGTVTGNLEKMRFASPQLQLALEGKRDGEVLQGTLSTPVVADLQAQTIDLPKVAAAFTLPNPAGGQLKTTAHGKMNVDLGKQRLATTLKGNLDESQFDVQAALTNFSHPAYQFNVAIDNIDVDRYQNKPAPTTAAAPPAAAQEQPIDLSALKGVKANGSIRIGSLKAAEVMLSKMRMDVRIADGKAEISPLEARLYDGSMSGSITATASNPARFSIAQRFNGVEIGPLLKDVLGEEPVIEGEGDVQLDLIAQGATVSQLKKTLNGTGKLELRDGAVRGINIAQTVRNAKAGLQALRGTPASPQAGTGNMNEKTDFSELKGSFNFDNGVMQNNDLSAKSPLLRMEGAGTVDLVEERLNYLVKATVVSSLEGQGGAELQALKGLTVPVRLTGPLESLAWNIDVKSLVADNATQELQEKKEAIKAKAKEEITEQKNELKEQLQEQLKGRFKGLFTN